MIASRNGIAALFAIAIGMAIGAGVQLALREPSYRVVLSTRTMMFPRPPRPASGSCPDSIATIGQASPGILSARSPDLLFGVAASATGCTIAIWNPDGTYLSRDDGATWSHVMTTGALEHGVAVGADETVFILAGDALVVARRDGRSAVRSLPFSEINRVAVSNGLLMVAAAHELAFSRDDGVTWDRRVPPNLVWRDTPFALFVDAAGTIRIALGGVTLDDPITLWIADGVGWRPVWTAPTHHPYTEPRYPDWHETHVAAIDGFAFARDGTLAAEATDHDGDRIFLVDPRGTVTVVSELPTTLDFAGTPIIHTHAAVGACDAHGELLFLRGRRGPVRSAARLAHMGAPETSTDRWIVGDLQPD